MLVDRAGGCRQHLERVQPLGLGLAMHARQQRRYPGGGPDREPFANIGRRPGNADGVDQRIGYAADRVELLAAEVEVLQRTCILGEAIAADEVVVKIFRSRPHAADVERHPRLERLARSSTVIINADWYVRGDGE